jgi:hypothetical protein
LAFWFGFWCLTTLSSTIFQLYHVSFIGGVHGENHRYCYNYEINKEVYKCGKMRQNAATELKF